MDSRMFIAILLLYSIFLSSTTAYYHYPETISELLVSAGLPGGLFPKDAVKNYDLDFYGRLKVYLDRPCLAKYENRVFFDKVVKANITQGALIGVEGLAQEELFLWLPVKDIYVDDPASGVILFDIGVAHKEMAFSIFEEPRACTPPTQGLAMPVVDVGDGSLKMQ